MKLAQLNGENNRQLASAKISGMKEKNGGVKKEKSKALEAKKYR
jgi:hypothetical protein